MQKTASLFFLIFLIATSSMLSGCASSGAFNTANVTDVRLAQANYEMVATDVTGQSFAAYLLGVSGSVYRQMQTFALVRIEGTGMIYGEAMENLWNNFRAEYGDVEGRRLGLVNVRYDTDALNAIIYTRATVSIRADVVEFTE